ncbi:hypothetical protein [Roseicella frigidaeris]|uniref:Uncharacterized protein n=1 Tax=Roseicella frigidaeris TaxID=2230885 RepID=A0A327M7L2_9PROT|nr:hypothetical protein [Roseicella frigidaeris]RAI58465.1 hypothetical protein DOO78_14045 [Roseicella frigidaeris]
MAWPENGAANGAENGARRSAAAPPRPKPGARGAGVLLLAAAALLLPLLPLGGGAQAAGAPVLVKATPHRPPARRAAPRLLPSLPPSLPEEPAAVPRITHAFRLAPVVQAPRQPCLTGLRRDAAPAAGRRRVAARPRGPAAPAVPLCVQLHRRETG